jgi:hypothetical protein
MKPGDIVICKEAFTTEDGRGTVICGNKYVVSSSVRIKDEHLIAVPDEVGSIQYLNADRFEIYETKEIDPKVHLESHKFHEDFKNNLQGYWLEDDYICLDIREGEYKEDDIIVINKDDAIALAKALGVKPLDML